MGTNGRACCAHSGREPSVSSNSRYIKASVTISLPSLNTARYYRDILMVTPDPEKRKDKSKPL